nr:deaminase domain-containing protein [Lysinibacillus odysseyi]
MSTVADFIPVVSNVKAIYEATVGKNPFTGRKLEAWERGASAASILGGPIVKGIKHGGKAVVGIIKNSGKSTKKPAAATKPKDTTTLSQKKQENKPKPNTTPGPAGNKKQTNSTAQNGNKPAAAKQQGTDKNTIKGTGNLSYTQKVDKYQERTQAIRDNLPSKYKKYGNVAVADVNISGLKSEFKAHSRIHKEYEGGFSYVIGEGKFPAKSVNHKGETDAPNAFLRANDTECKILEDISRQLGDDKTVKGTIDLFTELPACGSCTDIILQFRKEYPNIKLNVYSGEFKD